MYKLCKHTLFHLHAKFHVHIYKVLLFITKFRVLHSSHLVISVSIKCCIICQSLYSYRNSKPYIRLNATVLLPPHYFALHVHFFFTQCEKSQFYCVWVLILGIRLITNFIKTGHVLRNLKRGWRYAYAHGHPHTPTHPHTHTRARGWKEWKLLCYI
jgi:hypothetical protein